MKPTRIAAVRVEPMDCPLRESFEIAGGGQAVAANVLVSLRLADGTAGFGEAAPFPAFNGETQAGTLAAARELARALVGRSACRAAALAAELKERRPKDACARAGLEMALADAWSRSAGFPLRALFGGAEDRVATDVTIPIVPPPLAARAAARIRALGIRKLKIKVGRDAEADAERVVAAAGRLPPESLILDGNAGMSPAEALRLLRLVRRRGVRVDLFEQPVAAEDHEGLREVLRKGRVPVAADESAASLGAVLRLARARAVSVVNVKLMKTGLFESLELARAARAAGLGLMIGGLIESRLAMGCAAHFAAGVGGFRFVDLDMPLFFARDPMRGLRMRHGGVYDLTRVARGIGVTPRLD